MPTISYFPRGRSRNSAPILVLMVQLLPSFPSMSWGQRWCRAPGHRTRRVLGGAGRRRCAPGRDRARPVRSPPALGPARPSHRRFPQVAGRYPPVPRRTSPPHAGPRRHAVSSGCVQVCGCDPGLLAHPSPERARRRPPGRWSGRLCGKMLPCCDDRPGAGAGGRRACARRPAVGVITAGFAMWPGLLGWPAGAGVGAAGCGFPGGSGTGRDRSATS